MSRNPEKASDVLALVGALLDAGKSKEAVEIVRKYGLGSPELTNAYGVALMRAGDATRAVDVYRNLCINESGFSLKQNLPTAYKVNYATALLLTKNASGCLALLVEIDQEQDPCVRKLRAAIDSWRHSLGLWKRLAFDLYGAEPEKPVSLDFPPGELMANRELRPAA